MKNKPIHEVGIPIIACETYIVHNGRVLLHKRAEDKQKFPGFWIGPGGHVDEGEDVFAAAIREVQEETGLLVHSDNLKLKVLAFHHHVDRKEVWVEHLFRSLIATDQKIVSSSEGHSEWIPLEELPTLEKVFPPSQYYFDHILNDRPGILYNYSTWKNSSLVEVISQHIDTSP